MIALLLNHLWQSSLCVGGAGLIVLALRRNSAHVRFWLWFAASIKFLIPFAALTALGAYALGPMIPPVVVPTVALMEPLAKPFSAPAMVPVTTRLSLEPSADPAHFALPARSAPPALPTFHLGLGSALLALWLAGFLMLVMRWLVRWLRVRAVLHEAVDAQLDAPVAVKFSGSRLEPGLVGILNPVILLPQGIERQLSPAELRAVLAHELCHWRRHDNLLAAIHMLVEALFWFFPLVWWLGARLNAERECACDESVLAGGNDPQIYAEGILKVCRAYLQSPLACVAGVSGADLKKRIETIMENRLIQQLNAARRLVLSASAAVALAVPLALGLMTAPVTQTQAKAAPLPLPSGKAQISAEQTLPPAPEISTTTLPVSQLAESPVGSHAPQATATVSANAAAPAAFPQSLPDEASASNTVTASNDPPAAPVQQSIQQGAIVPPATLVALNDQPAASPPGTCTLPAVADQVTLEQLAGADLVTVPVAINGSPKHFLLDIGTNPTEVSQPTVAQLGLPENYKTGETIGAKNTNIAGLAFGNDLAALTNGGLGNVSVRDVRDNLGPGVSESRVRIAAFTVGRATGHNMVFLVANDARMGKSQSEPYDGLLTGSFFKQYDVELDFAGKQINWLTPTKCADPNQVVFWPHSAVGEIPMTIAGGKIQVPVMIQGHQINAVLDTSSAHTVMRRDIAELILGLKADTPDVAPDGDLKDGKGAQVYLHTFPQVSFAGGVIANNVPTLILTNSLTHEINSELVLGSWARSADARVPDLTLGMDVLHQLHMYVVPGQGKVYVTSAE